jgi:hypothetical protein
MTGHRLVNNWSVMAQAARDGGFEGIFFDNECYYENVWIYGSRCRKWVGAYDLF